MFFRSEMTMALKAVETTFERRNKLCKSLAKEVDNMSRLVERLWNAKLEARQEEALRAIGEPVGEGKKSTVSKLESDLCASAEKVAGLRSVIASLVPVLSEHRKAISAEIPAHADGITKEFAREWQAAAAAFAVVLGKRAAIENATGERLYLADPVGVLPQSDWRAETFRPYSALDSLKDIFEAARATPPDRHDPENLLAPFDPRQPYVMTKDFRDPLGYPVPAGMSVTEPMLSPGWLDLLVGIGQAIPMTDPSETAAMAAANASITEVERENRKKQPKQGTGVIPTPYQPTFAETVGEFLPPRIRV